MYQASATLKCTPKGARAPMTSTSTIIQKCFQVLNNDTIKNKNFVLARSTISGATQKVIENSPSSLFGGYDPICADIPITSVTVDKTYCSVGKSPTYDISCSLTESNGYNG